MPKVRELGVTVVPEGFGPLGIGPGGGCGATNPCLLCTQNVTVCGGYSQWACARVSMCTDCTTQPFSICGTTPGPVQQGGGMQQCSDCTTQAFSICGTTPGPGAGAAAPQCSDCTTQAFSICGTTPGAGGGGQQCSDCTTQAFSICGTTPGAGGGGQQCSDCTTQPFSICGTTPARQQRGLTLESIRQLRGHLEQQLAALAEAEKALLPKTEEAISARERELQQELERLRAAREELNRKE